jgi:glycosyltransferase involved in cell wall biosynthesis
MRTSRQDLISVIIPCYKDSLTLQGAIESVIRQTYSHTEIIVVNDASPETQEIEQIIKKYPSII